MEVYGRYLLNGGRPKDFLQLTHDDVQVMYIVLKAEENRCLGVLLESIAKMVGAEKR